MSNTISWIEIRANELRKGGMTGLIQTQARTRQGSFFPDVNLLCAIL